MSPKFDFYDEDALIERLSNGLRARTQEVVFLIGAPVSAPLEPGAPGVPPVNGVIELIRSEFIADPVQLQVFDQSLAADPLHRYQSAFKFLQGRRGPQAANEIVRRAVLASRYDNGAANRGPELAAMTDDDCRLIESDIPGWALGPGIKSIGQLVTQHATRFGKSLLTTNFDPLVEVAIRLAGGSYYRTVLHNDGNLSQTEATGLRRSRRVSSVSFPELTQAV
jgi:hypothetical protein